MVGEGDDLGQGPFASHPNGLKLAVLHCSGGHWWDQVNSMGPQVVGAERQGAPGHTVWLKQEGPGLRAVDECLSWEIQAQ